MIISQKLIKFNTIQRRTTKNKVKFDIKNLITMRVLGTFKII